MNYPSIRIEGAISNNLWLPHVAAYIPALEAIDTVSVVTSTFDADEGLAGGMSANVRIKGPCATKIKDTDEQRDGHVTITRNVLSDVMVNVFDAWLLAPAASVALPAGTVTTTAPSAVGVTSSV